MDSLKIVRTRKGGKRRKTGCMNCRSRHAKCDEQQPACGRCQRLGLGCEVANFIVPSNWCPLLLETPVAEQGVARPASTWDVFNDPSRALSRLPSPQTMAISSNGTLVIDSEMAELLHSYQRGVGAWMDLFDHGLNYQRGVVRRAYSSQLIMQALCALTSRQLSMVTQGEVWHTAAGRYYGESLRLLISALVDSTSSHEDALVATILLSSYELLASPGLDHRRHVLGAVTLIKKHDFTAQSKSLERASFWVYARLDISLALINECPTMLAPGEWNVSWAKQEMEEDRLANQILWILAKGIAFTFREGEPLPEADLLSRSELLVEMNTWFEALPPSVKGVSYGPPSRDGFVKHWFAVPVSAAVMFTYHLSNLLLLGEGVNYSIQKDDHSQAAIQYHAKYIGDICQSDIADAALVQGVQPLYYAAKHIDGLARKAKLWAILENIEARLGFHTSSRIVKLQELVEVG